MISQAMKGLIIKQISDLPSNFSAHELYDFKKYSHSYDKEAFITLPTTKAGHYGFNSVDYQINNWMQTGQVNVRKIEDQTTQLINFANMTYKKVHKVYFPKEDPLLFDIIFTANHWSAIRNSHNLKSPLFFVSNMAYKERQGEKKYIKEYLKALDFNPITLPSELNFEGGGDMIQTPLAYFCFVGSRTDIRSYLFIKDYLDQQNLNDRAFVIIDAPPNCPYYHGDLKLKPLSHIDPKSGKLFAFYYPEAFTQRGLQLLEAFFSLIPVSQKEANNFALNFVTGTNLESQQKSALIPDGCTKLEKDLKALGYQVTIQPLATRDLGGGLWCQFNEINRS